MLEDIFEEPNIEPNCEYYCASYFISNCYYASSVVLATTRLKKGTYEFCYLLHSLTKN
jgi:hypothetical protein